MNLFKAGCFALVLVSLVIAFFAFPLLPASVPTHWNAVGDVDGYGPSWVGAFMIPVMMFFVLGLFLLIPRIAVFRKNLEGFGRQYWILAYVMELFFILLYGLTLFPNFGYRFQFSQVMTLPLAMLFISLGILMPSFKRNFFVGIRTPWTLANDSVWEKTHKFAGRLFILAGFTMLFTIPFPRSTVFVILVSVLAAAIASVVYSYILFRKHPSNRL